MRNSSREEQLVAELQRTEYVWSNHIHNLCHGFYPERTPVSPHDQFKGTPADRIFQIFKVMDHEVRHIRKVLSGLGINIPQLPPNHEEIFEEMAKATGITENSHKD